MNIMWSNKANLNSLCFFWSILVVHLLHSLRTEESDFLCRSALEQRWNSSWPWSLSGAGAFCIYESVDLFSVSLICLLFNQSYDAWTVNSRMNLTQSENKRDALRGEAGQRQRRRPGNEQQRDLEQRTWPPGSETPHIFLWRLMGRLLQSAGVQLVPFLS